MSDERDVRNLEELRITWIEAVRSLKTAVKVTEPNALRQVVVQSPAPHRARPGSTAGQCISDLGKGFLRAGLLRSSAARIIPPVLHTGTVIPRLTKIIRSAITFFSRKVISRRFL